MTDNRWPALPYEEWKDTLHTLHMWTQVVGKVALAQAPPLNHSWGIAMLVTPRGLSTHVLPHGERTFQVRFDLVGHELAIEVSDGNRRALPLRPQTVAAFYAEVIETLRDLQLPVTIWPMPVEIAAPIRFDQDLVHKSYDAAAATRFFRVLTQAARVMHESRCQFIGKASPVHFFWGSFDLAVTRFSGRPAPDREGPTFMREAYSHEVISHGFWPGNEAFPQAAFYAYAVPQPAGLEHAAIEPAEARYDSTLNEFVLPYETVRTAAEPDAALHAFIDTTYAEAATRAGWDRAALERAPVTATR
jgi:hypothetical protein